MRLIKKPKNLGTLCLLAHGIEARLARRSTSSCVTFSITTISVRDTGSANLSSGWNSPSTRMLREGCMRILRKWMYSYHDG